MISHRSYVALMSSYLPFGVDTRATGGFHVYYRNRVFSNLEIEDQVGPRNSFFWTLTCPGLPCKSLRHLLLRPFLYLLSRHLHSNRHIKPD